MSSWSKRCPCGRVFTPPSGVGRPPDHCPVCRSTRRANDKAWKEVRARVLLEEQVCAVPGCDLPPTTVDHVRPLARGGSRLDRANLQAMCGPHNYAKGDRVNGDPRGALGASWDVPGGVRAGGPRCTCDDPDCPGRWHL